MLLSTGQADLLSWALAIAAFLVFAVPAVLLIRNEYSWGKFLLPLGLFAALMVAASKPAHGTRVLIVEVSQADGLVRVDRRLYGSAGYTMTNGSTPVLKWNSARQILVNDTPATLTVSKRLYGVTFAEPWEKRVAPFELATFDGSIDHFGPYDAPPATSEKWERYWVRW